MVLYNVKILIAASESLFSATGYQIWDRRNKISPQRVHSNMFLYEHEKITYQKINNTINKFIFTPAFILKQEFLKEIFSEKK